MSPEPVRETRDDSESDRCQSRGVRFSRRILRRVDSATSELSFLSVPARIFVVLLAAAGFGFACVAFVADFFDGHASSTGVLIFPAVAFYVVIAGAVVTGIDRLVSRLRAR